MFCTLETVYLSSFYQWQSWVLGELGEEPAAT